MTVRREERERSKVQHGVTWSHPFTRVRVARETRPPFETMENLNRLRAALRRALEQDNAHGSQELYDALQTGTSALRRAGKVPGKSAMERKDIEGGP
jgi:hypothetical protein